MTNLSDPRERATTTLRGVLDRVGRWVHDNPQMVDGFVFMLEQWTSSANDDVPPAERVMRALLPPNWWELEQPERVDATTFLGHTSVPLLWAPRAAIVREVVATTTKAERDAVLCAARSMIVADVNAVLDQCTHERIATLTLAGREASVTASEGRLLASQALSAAIVGEVLDKHFGLSKFRDARERFKSELPDKVSMRFWRRASLQSALLAAIALTWTDPPPDGFNRHLTAHGLSPEQYTEANALEGLLLVTGLIRELHEVYGAGHGGVPPLTAGPLLRRGSS